MDRLVVLAMDLRSDQNSRACRAGAWKAARDVTHRKMAIVDGRHIV
jgi:hypothetical protein